jgi:hypothetical protein
LVCWNEWGSRGFVLHHSGSRPTPTVALLLWIALSWVSV